MVKTGLQAIHNWNPTVTPKFGIVNFGNRQNKQIRGIIFWCLSVYL